MGKSEVLKGINARERFIQNNVRAVADIFPVCITMAQICLAHLRVSTVISTFHVRVQAFHAQALCRALSLYRVANNYCILNIENNF